MPCNCCHGARQQQRITIKKHPWQNGQDPYFLWPIVVCIFLVACVLGLGLNVQEFNLLANESFLNEGWVCESLLWQ